MADNKFLTRLKGKQAPKSSVQIDNDKLTPVFGNMPVGSDGLENIIEQSHSSTVVAKGAQNWYLSGSSMVLSDSDQYTSEFKVSGQGLWINSSYTFTSASVVAPSAKWVLRFCGDNLLDATDHKISLTVLIKAGSTTLATKSFMLDEQANFFCKVLELDLEDTYQSVHKFAAGSTLTVQVLCGNSDASATIYNGKTTLTLLQRMVDADTVAFNGLPLIDVMTGHVAEDYFNRYQEQVVDGDKGMPVFSRDGTQMELAGWEEKTSVQVAEHNTSYEAHEDIREELAGKQDQLTAGQNITIDENNVISATSQISTEFADLLGSPYDNENLAADLNNKQDTLTAGGGIIINEDNNVITVDVVDSTTSTATDKPLSANAGKELQDQIDNLQGRGRFLSVWDATTGLPTTEPETELPYEYHTGDYYIVGTVGTTNYKPEGTEYTGDPSTTVETNEVKQNDTYFYDGSDWTLVATPEKEVAFSTLAGSPYDNVNLAGALNDKANSEDNLTITQNDSDKIQAVGLIDKNPNSTTPIYDWVGTLAEYQAQNIAATHPNWLCFITDDHESMSVYTKSETNALLSDKQDKLTAGQGISITNNTIAVANPTLTNKATGIAALTIMGTPATRMSAVNIGASAEAGQSSVALGDSAKALGQRTITIGGDAKMANDTIKGSIQLGYGTTNNSGEFNVGLGNASSQYGNYTLLKYGGKIPTERLADNGTTGQVLKKTASGMEWADGGSGSEYTAGTGIDITDDEISVDDTVLRNEATASTSIIEHKHNIDQDMDATYATTLGYASIASNRGVAIGAVAQQMNASSSYDGGVAIGAYTEASNSSVAIGNATKANSESVAISGNKTGYAAQANGPASIAIGKSASVYANANNGVAVGSNSNAREGFCVSIGNYASSREQGAIAIGASGCGYHEQDISIGMNSIAGTSSATGVGYNIAIGSSAEASNGYSIAIGSSAEAKGTNSIAIGKSALTSGSDTISIGRNTASYSGGTVIGNNSSATQGVAIGNDSHARTGGIFIGQLGGCSHNYNTLIGNNIYNYSTRPAGVSNIILNAGQGRVESYGHNNIILNTSEDTSMNYGGDNNVYFNNHFVFDLTSGYIQSGVLPEFTGSERGAVPESRAEPDKYLCADGHWKVVQGGGGSLSELSDVQINSLENGEALVYYNNRWVNKRIGTDAIYTEASKTITWLSGQNTYDDEAKEIIFA